MSSVVECNRAGRHPCIVGSTSGATKFTISGIDGSRVDLTVTAGDYKVGEVVSQRSTAVQGILQKVFRYSEVTLHTSDRVFGSFPYEGELAYQNATSGASGTVVYRNMTSGMIRIRHSIGAFDTIGKLSFSRTQSTSNAPVSVMRLGYVKLRVGRVRGSVLFTRLPHCSCLHRATLGRQRL